MRGKRCLVCYKIFASLKLLNIHYKLHTKKSLIRALLVSNCLKTSWKCGVKLKKKKTSEYMRQDVPYLKESEMKSDSNEDIKPDLNYLHQKTDTETLRNFRFQPYYNSKATQNKSLNEKSGEFYICKCSDAQKLSTADIFQKSDLDRLLSDTESCSDVEDFICHPPTTKKFFCDSCGNGYRTKSGLARHVLVHEMKCEVCDRRFISRMVYKEHMKCHLRKVFACHLCEKEFAHKAMLLDHLDAHIEDEVYENVFGLERDYKFVPRQIYFPVGFE